MKEKEKRISRSIENNKGMLIKGGEDFGEHGNLKFKATSSSQYNDHSLEPDEVMAKQEINNCNIKLSRELTKEKEEIKEEPIGNSINNTKENMYSLGIVCNMEGNKKPCCGKVNKKRSRKMLVELRSETGKDENKEKIHEILKVGKGKVLPSK